MPSAAERRALVLAAVWLAAALHGLGAADIVGDDEAREAGIVQDVVAGHWLWPRFNEELLPDKPILYHWLAAVPCAVAGFSEAAVRLPSTLAGATLVAWTAGFGGALLGARTALLAAGLLATTPALFAAARVARPDVLLVLLLSGALGFAFRWWRDARRRDATAALALVGAATLAKGPVAPALFGLTLVGFLAWQGQLRRLPRLATVPGVAAFLILGIGWYALALAGWRDLFVREHLVGRYLRNLAGGLVAGRAYSVRPLVYHACFYVEHLPVLLLPWTPLVALALWRAWRTGGFGDPRLRFLLCWAAAPIVLFTPAEWKLRHYLLPALPALALVAAPALAHVLALRPRPLRARGLLEVAAAGLALAGAALLLRGRLVLSPSDRSTLDALLAIVPGGASGTAVAIGFGGGFVLVALACRAWAALAGVAAAAVVGWMIVGAPALEQAISRRDSLKDFARAAAVSHPPPRPLAFYGATVRPVAVYVGRPVPPLSGDGALSPGLAVIATEAALPRLARSGVVALPVLAAEGRIGNLARGRIFLLELTPPVQMRPPPSSGMGPAARTDYPADHAVARALLGGSAPRHGSARSGPDDQGAPDDDARVHDHERAS